MTTAQEREKQGKREDDKREVFEALIAEQIVHLLGKPAALRTMQVRRLWENCYRVNILVGEDVTSVKIANSYFLKVGSDGTIIHSTPKIIGHD